MKKYLIALLLTLFHYAQTIYAETNYTLACTNPAITGNPSNSPICQGANTAFSVTATGTDLTYKWQVNQGYGYTDVIATPNYSNVNTNTLSLTNVPATFNNYVYQCIVSGSCGSPVTSGGASLFVTPFSAIISQPVSVSTCEENQVSLSVSASGTSLTYQWQVNQGSGFTNIINNRYYNQAEASTLYIIPPAGFNNYTYRCMVTGTCTNPLTSNAATLTVKGRPLISVAPSASTVCAGSNTTFSVTATGASITYQWQVNQGSGFTDISNNANYFNATGSSLLLTTVPASFNSYSYRCVVNGECTPSATSSSALLSITPTATVSSSPSSKSLCAGENTSLSVSANGTSLSYQWQAYSGGTYGNLSNNGTYSNVQSATLNISNATAGLNGIIYRCVVSGSCTPAANSGPATVTVYSLPYVYAGADQLACSGSEVMLSGSGALSYTWDNGVTDGVSFVPTNTLTYTVTGTDANECSNTDQVTITTETCTDVEAGIDDAFILYPNPAREVLYIEYANTTLPEKIIVINCRGEEVLTIYQVKEIPVEQLASGLYTLDVIFKEKVVVRNFIVK